MCCSPSFVLGGSHVTLSDLVSSCASTIRPMSIPSLTAAEPYWWNSLRLRALDTANALRLPVHRPIVSRRDVADAKISTRLSGSALVLRTNAAYCVSWWMTTSGMRSMLESGNVYSRGHPVEKALWRSWRCFLALVANGCAVGNVTRTCSSSSGKAETRSGNQWTSTDSATAFCTWRNDDASKDNASDPKTNKLSARDPGLSRFMVAGVFVEARQVP